MTLCQFDDAAECNVARVAVGGPRVAVLAGHPGGYMCRVPIVSCGPLFQGARVSFQVSDTTPIQDPRESVKSLFYICHAFPSLPPPVFFQSLFFSSLISSFFQSTKSPRFDVSSPLFIT